MKISVAGWRPTLVKSSFRMKAQYVMATDYDELLRLFRGDKSVGVAVDPEPQTPRHSADKV